MDIANTIHVVPVGTGGHVEDIDGVEKSIWFFYRKSVDGLHPRDACGPYRSFEDAEDDNSAWTDVDNYVDAEIDDDGAGAYYDHHDGEAHIVRVDCRVHGDTFYAESPSFREYVDAYREDYRGFADFIQSINIHVPARGPVTLEASTN